MCSVAVIPRSLSGPHSYKRVGREGGRERIGREGKGERGGGSGEMGDMCFSSPLSTHPSLSRKPSGRRRHFFIPLPPHSLGRGCEEESHVPFRPPPLSMATMEAAVATISSHIPLRPKKQSRDDEDSSRVLTLWDVPLPLSLSLKEQSFCLCGRISSSPNLIL